MQNSIPIEIALKIASSLQDTFELPQLIAALRASVSVELKRIFSYFEEKKHKKQAAPDELKGEESDVCSFGSCSRFWRELCGSDCVWESLYRQRWPALDPQMKPSSMGWRECYIDKHKDVDRFATDVVQQFSCTESIDVGQYLSAIEGMCLKELGFKDVQMFFFKPNLSVLINLMGLHYCISWLGVPTAYVVEALDSCKISEREVCVQRLKIPRGFGGYRYICRTFPLADIASGNEDTVLGLLRHRGPITEPYRLQISVVKPDTPQSANDQPLREY